MTETKTIFESTEDIYGVALGLGSNVIDMIRYTGTLTVKSSGLKSVSISLKAERPYPNYVKIPLEYLIQERTITAAYMELILFFKKYNLEFRG